MQSNNVHFSHFCGNADCIWSLNFILVSECSVHWAGITINAYELCVYECLPMQHNPWISSTCFLSRIVNSVQRVHSEMHMNYTHAHTGKCNSGHFTHSNERMSCVVLLMNHERCALRFLSRFVRNAIRLCSVRPHSCWNIIKVYIICVQYHINIVCLFRALYLLYSRFEFAGESTSHAHTRMHGWHSCRRRPPPLRK